MPFKKQPYNWQRVKAGDIISFTYHSSRSTAKKNNCILVLNPRIPVVRKDGSSGFHLTGIKLKENNKPRVFFTSATIRLLERIGEFVPVNYEDDIFRLDIDRTFLISEIKRVKNNGFNKISTSAIINRNYRTYDYRKSRKSPVYLEPLKVSNKKNYQPEEVEEDLKEFKKDLKDSKERDITTNKKEEK